SDALRVTVTIHVQPKLGLFVVAPVDERNLSVLRKDLISTTQERFPALAVPVRTKSGGRGGEGRGLLAEDLQAPQIDLLELVQMRGQTLEIEYNKVRDIGDLRRCQWYRLVRLQCPRGKKDVSRCLPDLLGLLPPRLFESS